MKQFLINLLLVTGLCAQSQFKLQPDPGKLASESVREASGLAVSPTNASLLWLIDDSGAKPEIHLTNVAGEDLGFVTLAKANNRDWEDLASFTRGGKPYLLVADTGDNSARRETCLIHIFPEPSVPVKGMVTGYRTIEFRYPDGPRDCESAAVDAENGKIILVSKRNEPPKIYELPLFPDDGGIQTARIIGATDVTPPRFNLVPFGSQPTALDISADGKTAAILTYYGVFVFHREEALTWEQTFKVPPAPLSRHRLPQAEGLALSADGKTIFVVSEGGHSPIVTYRLGG